jgi:hypothetical protein
MLPEVQTDRVDKLTYSMLIPLVTRLPRGVEAADTSDRHRKAAT